MYVQFVHIFFYSKPAIPKVKSAATHLKHRISHGAHQVLSYVLHNKFTE